MDRWLWLQLLVIALVFALCFVPFWGTWLYQNIDRARKRRLTLWWLKKWGISTWRLDPKLHPMVHYLNPAGQLKSMTVLEFTGLRLPKDEMPKWHLVRIGESEEEIAKKDTLRLIYEGTVDDRNWHVSPYANISSNAEGIWIYLYDRDSRCPRVEVPITLGNEGLFVELLSFVANYKDLNDAWIAQLKERAVPILEQTKETMGHSSQLQNLRIAISNGPSGYGSPVNKLVRI